MTRRDDEGRRHNSDLDRTDLEELFERLQKMQALPQVDGRPDKLSQLDPGVRDALGRMSPDTAKWLANKRPDELILLDEVCERLRTIKTLGKFGRWLIVTIVGCLITGLTLGDKLSLAWKWVSGGAK